MNRFNLEMEGVLLRLENIRNDSGLIRFTFETEFLEVVDVRIPRRPAVMSIADVQRLVKYLHDHIGANSPHDIASSFTFVTYELDFQLHAQAGVLESWDDGCFTWGCADQGTLRQIQRASGSRHQRRTKSRGEFMSHRSRMHS